MPQALPRTDSRLRVDWRICVSAPSHRKRIGTTHSICNQGTPRRWFSTAWWMLTYVVLPLAVGGIVYILWRAETLRWFSWASSIGLGPFLRQLRAIASPARATIPSWVVYSLPGGLWLFATTNAIRFVWGNDQSSWRGIWLSAAFTLGVGSEFAQAVALIPGRFDPVDLALYLTGFLVACLCPLPGGNANARS